MREFDLLKHIYGLNAGLPPHVVIPPGDDMGAVRVAGAEVLVTVDQVADGVHFDLATTPIEKIARKAITRNLSDVAAMGALPVGCVAAACLPRRFDDRTTLRLFDAMRKTAASYDCPLFGGDVSMWDGKLLLSVTVLAHTGGTPPLTRAGAQVGDIICVTGMLGGSMMDVNGYIHHLDFEPRLRIARQLACTPATRPRCMIDLSDGLARDLRHLCEAAGVSAELYADRLPIRPGCDWRNAVGDGEDYELCFTFPESHADHDLPAHIAGVPVTRIGRIVEREKTSVIRMVTADGQAWPVGDLGWEHQGV